MSKEIKYTKYYCVLCKLFIFATRILNGNTNIMNIINYEYLGADGAPVVTL